MFYLVGLGLGDAKDVTVKGLEIIKKCKRVYLEAYTSILTVGKQTLEEFYGREVILADREMVESMSEEEKKKGKAGKSSVFHTTDTDGSMVGAKIPLGSLVAFDILCVVAILVHLNILLADSDQEDIAFLVVGDPLGATTHTDLILRAREKKIQYRVVHNASIMNAVGCCGLQLYNFGETVSIVFWTDTWRPDSFYDKIKVNRDRQMHTLCLLDIKVKEQSIENLMRGKKVYEPPRYMTVAQAAEQLLEIVQRRREQGEINPAMTEETICVGLARVGAEDQRIVSATLQDMANVDLGGPLHSLVIPGFMHPLEKDMLKLFANNEYLKQLLESNG